MNVFAGLLKPCRTFAPHKDRHEDHPDILAMAGTWVYAKDVAVAIGRPVSYASVTLREMAERDLIEVRKVKVPWAKPMVNQYRRMK